METYFVSILFGVVGLVFLVISFSLIRISFVKRDFLNHSATVVEAKITESYSNANGVKYGILIICSYQYDNKNIEGSPAVFHYPPRIDLKSLNSVIENQYPVGKSVEIFINPSDPSEYVFEKKIRVRDIIPSVVFLFLGGGLVFYTLKSLFLSQQ